MKRMFMLSIMMIPFFCLAGQQAQLLKNINYGSASSYIMYMTELNGKVIFKATNSGNSNNELWVTDGTADGTYLLKEINPSTNTGSDIGQMTIFNNEAYFSANDGTHGAELWKSNGTTDGTVIVKDISPGSHGSQPGHLVVWNNNLYFKAFHPDSGTELWKTGGTAESTQLVADITPGAASTNPGYLFPTSCGLYFNGLNNLFLYFSDGTSANSFLLSDKISVGQLDNAFFTEYKNEVYFRAVDATSGTGSQLWKTSGNAVTRVTGIVSGTTQFNPRYLTLAGGKLFMVGEQEPNGRELWVLDDSGIRMVKDINPDGHGGLAGGFFTEFRGKLVFTANPPASGEEVWVSDGTANGTKIIKDLNPGSAGSRAISPVIIGDTLYYSADDGTGGELWRLLSPDGQPEKFTNITGGGAWGPELARIGKTFVFSAGDAVNGTELWKMTLSGSTDIPGVTENPSFRIFPNPATDHLTVELCGTGMTPAVITIYDISGRKVYECTANERVVSINNLSALINPGLYIVKIIDKPAAASARIIVKK